MKEVIAYTDGACSGNPGPGGWGVVLICEEPQARREMWGHLQLTTNNVAELTAIREGLKAITVPCEVVIATDSNNAIGWLSKGWKRNNIPVSMICQEIDILVEKKGITLRFEKVSAHSGIALNERVDHLAVLGSQGFEGDTRSGA